MKFFAEKCFKTLPVVAANSQIVQLRTKQVQDAEAEASGASAAAAGNVDIGELMSDVTNLAVDAITKEMKYESFAEQEELQREVGLENKGRNEVEDVKDKMECLQRLERQSDAKGQADIQQVNV